MTAAPRRLPFAPSKELRMVVMAHSLVSVSDAARCAPLGLAEETAAVYEAVRAEGGSVPVFAIAARQALSIAVAATLVADLVDDGLLCLHLPVVQTRRLTERITAGLRRATEPMPVLSEAARWPLLKIAVIGEPESGVTSFIGSLSDTPPVGVEGAASLRIRNTDEEAALLTTTFPNRWVTDYGVSTLATGVRLALVGSAGLGRLAELPPDVLRDAQCAVVLTRSDRLDQADSTVSALLQAGMGFGVVANLIGETETTSHEVRQLLELAPAVPVALCDARYRVSVSGALSEVIRACLQAGSPS